ncbi:biopolymer transport protein ExbD [Crenobacter luteus]|uniref:Biopolymer transporter ExbD n=1 Tax=Crenobacter luteus TaxID=1452487 RepID=A0A161SFS2_9NEIS|nr:biopolymer transporter ExbD [Crenobacter luteus]KZE31700.1 biopolymer transporter ExbD [Crenobacter luteus]TCP15564.1 biopolymer transport protein ExbD [Crenobacter luteus]
MNFRRGRHREEPEINFIPLIDVLLVILIFLMVTTTYSHFSQIEVKLPSADVRAQDARDNAIPLAVAVDGKVELAGRTLAAGERDALVAALKAAAAGKREPVVVVNADARATHQAVVDVMEAARQAGLTQLTFATQKPS